MSQPRVLCLDEDQFVLDHLERMLRVDYTVVSTTDPDDALALLAECRDDPFPVMISGMWGHPAGDVDPLEQAQAVSPYTTRVLLTDEVDLLDLVAAVNRGHISQLLLKPCPVQELRESVAAATYQHRLARERAERARNTLRGCVEALLATLKQAQPELVERARRLAGIARSVCACLAVPEPWEVESAAQLTMVGAVSVPDSTARAVITGIPATDSDAHALVTLFDRAGEVLARVPALDPVREIIRHQLPTDLEPGRPLAGSAPAGAWVLQAIREYDALVHRDTPADLAIATLRARGTHEPAVIEALAASTGVRPPNHGVREVTATELKVGDELADDVHSARGQRLVSRGQTVTEQLLERVRNFGMSTGLQGRILIVDGR
jgi:response regulator RpfG family c-di-GMP phosphodiesterase